MKRYLQGSMEFWFTLLCAIPLARNVVYAYKTLMDSHKWAYSWLCFLRTHVMTTQIFLRRPNQARVVRGIINEPQFGTLLKLNSSHCWEYANAVMIWQKSKLDCNNERAIQLNDLTDFAGEHGWWNNSQIWF